MCYFCREDGSTNPRICPREYIKTDGVLIEGMCCCDSVVSLQDRGLNSHLLAANTDV